MIKAVERSVLPHIHNGVDNAMPHIFNRQKAIANFTIFDRKGPMAEVDIRRQDLDAHVFAVLNILGNLRMIAHDAGH